VRYPCLSADPSIAETIRRTGLTHTFGAFFRRGVFPRARFPALWSCGGARHQTKTRSPAKSRAGWSRWKGWPGWAVLEAASSASRYFFASDRRAKSSSRRPGGVALWSATGDRRTFGCCPFPKFSRYWKSACEREIAKIFAASTANKYRQWGFMARPASLASAFTRVRQAEKIVLPQAFPYEIVSSQFVDS
jgi:hypothetical protein